MKPGAAIEAVCDKTTDDRLSITAIVLAFNEEIHIRRCLERILPHVQRVVVVDSFSTDKTVEIARDLGAEVLQHPFKHQADQFQWALDTLDIQTDWVLKLDSDEYLEPSAQEWLRQKLVDVPADVTGLEFKRKVIFQGRFIRHGRYYQTVLLRLWRRGCGAIEQRWMDEHAILLHGRSTRVDAGDLVDDNLNDMTYWIDKHNRYATRAMVDFINREHPIFWKDERIKDTDSSAGKKRFLKNSLYARAPLYLRAFLFYAYRYIFRLGFLDGREGLVFHFMHGCWVFMLIDAKIDEARRFIRAHGIEAFKQHLVDRHRIQL
ncbi:glycosyltransferase family 2 protein [Methylocystis sp. SC2]|uniref:glycosyltransferase family 2 protein n=1 Tax=Methylocystis sp. (strain SC2) TaxID=187303 RepID=UPI00027AF3CB|nr:glycosyltransferase family 2 protein [Methylocystis sp. SC2]CCJ07826.1 Glycosyl transferase family 2 [Methylocystis sp. SC2]